MSVITIKVDEALKNGSAAVLDELGLDLPTAIRMYLKSIVRENGLPISTKLPAAPAAPAAVPEANLDEEAEEALEEDDLIDDVAAEEEEPAPAEPAAEEIPAVEEPAAAEPETPAVTFDYETRSGRKAVAAIIIDAICSIPEGMLTRWSDMEEGLSAKYGTEVKRPSSIRWPAAKEDGTEIPYWRIIGERGAVRGDKMIEQAAQEEKLKAVGHTFVSAGHGIFTGIKVDGYKDKLVKW